MRKRKNQRNQSKPLTHKLNSQVAVTVAVHDQTVGGGRPRQGTSVPSRLRPSAATDLTAGSLSLRSRCHEKRSGGSRGSTHRSRQLPRSRALQPVGSSMKPPRAWVSPWHLNVLDPSEDGPPSMATPATLELATGTGLRRRPAASMRRWRENKKKEIGKGKRR